VLWKSLQRARELVGGGEYRAQAIAAEMRAVIETAADAQIDYIALADPETLQPVATNYRPNLGRPGRDDREHAIDRQLYAGRMKDEGIDHHLGCCFFASSAVNFARLIPCAKPCSSSPAKRPLARVWAGLAAGALGHRERRHAGVVGAATGLWRRYVELRVHLASDRGGHSLGAAGAMRTAGASHPRLRHDDYAGGDRCRVAGGVAGKRVGLEPDLIFSLSFWMLLPGILGARAFYVVEYWPDYWRAYADPHGGLGPFLAAVVNVAKGGLVVYGAFFAGVAGLLLFVRQASLAPVGDCGSDCPQPGPGPGHRAARLPDETAAASARCAIALGAITFPEGAPARVHAALRGPGRAGQCTG